MDEKLQKQLIRQLKLLNFWITFFGSLLVIGIVVLAFVLFQIISAIQTTTERLQSLQDKATEQLDVKAQVCEGSPLLANTDFCAGRER